MQTELILPVNKKEVLNNAANHYHRTFRSNNTAREYLQKFGIVDEVVYSGFKIGYADGSLLKLVNRNDELKSCLTELGLLNSEGKEIFHGCCVVPVFDADGNCCGFYGISPGPDFLCVSESEGVINSKALEEYSRVILTDSLLNCLAVYQAGHRNVIPLSANHKLTEEHKRMFKLQKIEKVYFAVNNKKAEKNISEYFGEFDVPCFVINFPNKLSACEYLKEYGSDKLKQYIDQAEPVRINSGKCEILITDESREFMFSERIYIVKEIDPEDRNRLRVNIRARKKENNGRFHVDTLDLYVSRNRACFVNSASRLFGETAAKIENDMCLIIEKLEKSRQKREIEEEKEKKYVMTEYEKEEALELLNDQNILERVTHDLDICGYVGEEINKKIGYLITISRKLSSPLSGVIMSGSGAGKSKLMEHLASFVPEEDVVWYTRITPQALYYNQEKSLKHKLLIACEEEGLSGANYSIRELISSKVLRMASPVKDPVTGKMKTVEYEVEGPISLLFSTTSGSINYENATRCIELTLDESEDQTKRIQDAQRMRKTYEGIKNGYESSRIMQIHKNAQRLLKNLLIVNPYASCLTFSDKKLSFRREHEKYLSLIDAIALLYQYQREIKSMKYKGTDVEYVEVEIEDIEKANEIMTELLGSDLDDLSKPGRQLLEIIRRMVVEKAENQNINIRDYKFNRRDIREFCGWSDFQVRVHIRQLEDQQYVIPVCGQRGRMYKYELAYDGDNKRFVAGLMDVEKLKNQAQSFESQAHSSRGTKAQS